MTIPARRRFLRQLALAGAAVALPLAALAYPTEDALRPLGTRFSGLFADPESARAIGRRYLALTATEGNPGLLTALICGTQDNYRRLAGADIEQLREILTVQQQQDFAAGRTVSIDGWVLSRTEARLCAVAALA